MRYECQAKIKWDVSRNQEFEELQKRVKEHDKEKDQQEKEYIALE